MAVTYVQIGSTVIVGAGGATSIDFNSIPGTYTDLIIIASLRHNTTDTAFACQANGSVNPTYKNLGGTGSAVFSDSVGYSVESSSYTANTFSNMEIYIPNYANTTTNKSFSINSVTENSATAAVSNMTAGLFSTTSAITSLKLIPFGAANYVQYSSATLYGIKKN